MKHPLMGFPGSSVGEASAYNAEDPGSIPELGRYPGEGNGNPFQYSCLENSTDRGAWQATVHRVAKSQTWLSKFHFHFHVLWTISLTGKGGNYKRWSWRVGGPGHGGSCTPNHNYQEATYKQIRFFNSMPIWYKTHIQQPPIPTPLYTHTKTLICPLCLEDAEEKSNRKK